MRRLLALTAIVPLTLAVWAHAADQTILGKQIQIKDAKPGDPTKRKIVGQGKEKASTNTIVGDPTVGGASLFFFTTGATSGNQAFVLPTGTDPASGKPFWAPSGSTGFKYKDKAGTNGPVKVAQIKQSSSGTIQVKAVLLGKNGPITLPPPNLGTSACMAFKITDGDVYHVLLGAGSTIKKNDAKTFQLKDAVSEGLCPLLPTCGNGIVDPGSGEQCDPAGPPTCGSCNADCTCPCDFLDPSFCMYPFPSDFLTVADSSTDTGRRVNFVNAAMPQNTSAIAMDAAPYRGNDGFSPGSSMLLKVPGIDLGVTGAVPITDVERSFDADAPIVVINASTGLRHLIWSELDANASTDAVRSLIIRPAVNFDEATRYIVALRNLKTAAGAVIPPSATFKAYRDGTLTSDQVIEARRPHMESLFTTLASAGIGRNDLYLAWDFTVASERNLSERLLFMRDDAFARLGSAAPAFTITNVEDEVDDRIFRRVTGTYQVERYVDSETPPAKMVLDGSGLPTHQGTQTASFICNIPRAALASASATAVPARASIYGHGLLGSNSEVNGGNVRSMANEHNFVFCATKWIGMADEDVGNAITILQELGKFPSLTDRLQQSMVNQLFLARLMIHPDGFTDDPAFQDASGDPVIDTSAVFYDGNSQGGIFGGTVMAVAQDITRGVLGVPGMNYSLLLTRSTDFALYSSILYPAYPDELTRPLLLSLIQMLWDRSDPSGYAHHITSDPLPNTPAHKVLLHLAFGDHQVANVATEVEARTLGLYIHQPAIAGGRHSDVNPYFGIPAIPSDPYDGSALIVWDSGAAQPPITNVAPSVSYDPHSDPRNSPVARNQKSDFLKKTGGTIVDVCTGAPCVAPH